MDTRRLTDPPDIGSIAREARNEPVIVIENGEAAFVAVEPKAFERMAEAEAERRREAGKKLIALLEEGHRKMAARFTPEELAREIAAIERELADED
jgi:hypothetical protein